MGRPAEYSGRDFVADVDREFAFLVSSMGFTREPAEAAWRRAGTTVSDPMALPLSDVAPLVRFRAGEIEVSIAHDPRCEVQLLVRCPDRPPGSVDPEGMARIAGARSPTEYSGIYSSSTTTPGEVLHRLAAALLEFSVEWLEPD